MAIAPVTRAATARDPDNRVRSLFSSFATQPRAPASIAGLEQEFSVWLRGGPVDFHDLIDRVAPATALRRFAFDENARIMPSGAIWTVDSPHAEIATPPRELNVGIASRLARDALAERAALRRRLPPGAELRGYSTHLNAFATDVDGWALAGRFATTYAPAIMLVTERLGSPGLLVRPRHQRLEIGTEFLETQADLVVAGLLVLAGVIAAWHACRAAEGIADDGAFGSAAAGLEPPPLDGRRLRRTWQRPGLFVARDAFGDDLYVRGRTARLRRADGSWELAGDRLETTWAHLRPIAERIATSSELVLADAVVAGDRLTPLERNAPQDPRVPHARWAPTPRPDRAAALLATRRRGNLGLSPEYLTWDLAVLRVVHPERTFFLRVPRPAAQRLERLWARGTLDAPLTRFAIQPATGAVARLDEPAAGLFDAVEAPTVAAERMEATKTAVPPGSKRKRRMLPPPLFAPPLAPVPPVVRPGPRTVPWWPILLIGLIVVLTTVVVWTNWPGRPGPSGSPAPSNTQLCASQGVAGQVASCPSPSPSASPTLSGSPAPSCPPGFAVADGCPTQSPGLPSATPCPIGVPCQSPGPGLSPSPGVTPCPIGAVCASPSPRPRPTPRPTLTPRPTPTPDRTGPAITRLAWNPATIGAPLPAVGTCLPGNTLSQSVNVSALVVDPSGVKSVVLLYKRESDAAPVSAAMSLSAGRYRVTLTTASNAPAWQPVNLSYVVALSVRATDAKGNVRTTAAVAGFTVQRC